MDKVIKRNLKNRINELAEIMHEDEVKTELSQLEMRLAKKTSKRLRKLDARDSDSVVGFRMVVISSHVASMAREVYEETDGELYDYLSWFIRSSASLVRLEHLDVIPWSITPLSFFSLIEKTVRNNKGNYRLAAKELHITCNHKAMKKAISISKEYDLCR